MRAGLLLLIAGCYAPTVTPGAPCSVDGACPSGLVCTPAGTCELTAVAIDAPRTEDSALADTARAADAALPTDAHPVDAVTGPFCYGSALIKACFTQPPSGMIVLPTQLDTASTQCNPAFTSYCLIAAGDILVQGSVRVSGSRPLVLLAANTIAMTASSALDGSAKGVTPGPGARTAGCAPSAPVGQAGGAGGTFGTRGGNGGPALNGAPTPAADVMTIAQLEGGCSGGAGGGSPNLAGKAGGGGGALYLIAGSAINLGGTLDASGGGGTGAIAQAGGGGAGAGGFIGLDAPVLSAAVGALIFANGGGGGEGGGVATGQNGADPTSPNAPAAGGTGTAPNSGDGGAGAYLSTGATTGGPATTSVGSGGGGGGGAGVIHAYNGALPASTNVSPPPS